MGNNPNDPAERIVWPFPAHPEEGRSESYAWSTDVMTGYSFEQRLRLRTHPKFSMNSTFILTASQYGAAKTLLQAVNREYNSLRLPLWTERVFVTHPISGSTLRIRGDFRYSRFVRGEFALVWLSVDEHYVVRVRDFSADRLFIYTHEFPDLTGRSVIVMPLFEGRVNGDASIAFSDDKRPVVQFDFASKTTRQQNYIINVLIAIPTWGGALSNRLVDCKAYAHMVLDCLEPIYRHPWLTVNVRVIGHGKNIFGSLPQGPLGSVRMTVDNLHLPAQLTSLRSFIDGIAYRVTTAYDDVLEEVEDMFSTSGAAMNFYIDSQHRHDLSYVDNVAAITAMVDRTSGPFSSSTGKAVDAFFFDWAAPVAPTDPAIPPNNVLTGYLVAGQAASMDSVSIALRERFYGYLSFLGDYEPFVNTVAGRVVVPRKAVVLEGATSAVSKSRTVFETAQGIDWYVDLREKADSTYVMTFETMGAAERHSVLAWLHSVQGQLKPFWLAFPNNDLMMVSDQIERDELTVKTAGLDNPGRLNGKRIQIELKKGRLLHGRIDTVSPSSGNSMIAKLVNPLFKRLDVREVASIHLLQYCRLTTDTIEVVHDNLWQTRISVTVTTIDDPAED